MKLDNFDIVSNEEISIEWAHPDMSGLNIVKFIHFYTGYRFLNIQPPKGMGIERVSIGSTKLQGVEGLFALPDTFKEGKIRVKVAPFASVQFCHDGNVFHEFKAPFGSEFDIEVDLSKASLRGYDVQVTNADTNSSDERVHVDVSHDSLSMDFVRYKSSTKIPVRIHCFGAQYSANCFAFNPWGKFNFHGVTPPFNARYDFDFDFAPSCSFRVDCGELDPLINEITYESDDRKITGEEGTCGDGSRIVLFGTSRGVRLKIYVNDDETDIVGELVSPNKTEPISFIAADAYENERDEETLCEEDEDYKPTKRILMTDTFAHFMTVTKGSVLKLRKR